MGCRVGAGAIVEVTVEVKQKGSRLSPPSLLYFLVRPARLERATFWFVAKRSIQLSYGRV
jgi:hypothetical protein